MAVINAQNPWQAINQLEVRDHLTILSYGCSTKTVFKLFW